jgi:hypothetical protein
MKCMTRLGRNENSPSGTFSPRLWAVVPPKGRKSKIDPSGEAMEEDLERFNRKTCVSDPVSNE